MTAEPMDNVLPLHQKPTASFVAVTPEMAARWLARNTRNRTIRKSDLDRYKRDIATGRWHMEGSPLRFAPDGTLLDGQHRLTAIVETGATLTLLVVRGIAVEAQNVMDTGRKRTAADALAINGHKNSAAEAAVARIVIEVETNHLDSAGNYDISHEEIAATIDANPDISTAIEFTKPLARRTDCPPAMVAYTYLVMCRIDPVAAAEFWVGMADKIGLREGDPVIALSNRFAEARRNRERINRRTHLSMIYRAWNARRKGDSLRYLRINSNGSLIPIPKPR